MKIFMFQGGLGNQLFQYAYYVYLCKCNPQQTIYGFYPYRALRAHNGLEISKWFDVELPKSTFKSSCIAYALFWVNKIFWKIQKPHPFTDTDRFRKPNAVFTAGFWQDKKYFLEANQPCLKKNISIGAENNKFLHEIENSNSIAIHVRRGDYTDNKVKHIYGNICTENFYINAIGEIRRKVANPRFFIFSDDTEYVEELFGTMEKTIISCNKGKNSFFDMYLMAHCKHMIIANSTFSCWAAYLNTNNPIVICPRKWRNDRPSPPITFDNWIKI